MRNKSVTDALTDIGAEARREASRDAREAGDAKETPTTARSTSNSEAPTTALKSRGDAHSSVVENASMS